MAKDEKNPRRERPTPDGGARRLPPRERRQPVQSLSDEIMGIDTELFKLLLRRSELMNKLRHGKGYASNPGMIKSEKQIRSAWEEQAGRLGGNPRLSRQLFGLIQDLEIHAEREGERRAPYNLNPSRQPVSVNIPGPSSTTICQLWLALAAAGGRSTRLRGPLRSAPMFDFVRALEQTGVQVNWEENDIVLEGGQTPDYHGKAVFLGNDPLTLYLFIFLGLAEPGKLRFTGGPALKDLDLTALSRFLPHLGARLVSVLPGSKGLPVNLECGGAIPDEFAVPAELPCEAVLALLLAALTWKRRISISLEHQSPDRQGLLEDLAKRAFTLMPSLGQVLVNSIDYNGYAVSDLDFPPELQAPLDPCLSAAYLTLPIFAGGQVTLTGRWTHPHRANEIIELFKKFGLEVRGDDQAVSGSLLPNAVWPESLELEALSPELHPLFWVLNARLAYRAKGPIGIRHHPADADLDAAEDFLAQTGCRLERKADLLELAPMPASDFKDVAARSYGWVAPGPCWGIALSLAAFLHSNLKLGNPDCVSEVLPDYWHMYNRLPSPKVRKSAPAAEAREPAKARRRIRTDVLAEPEIREDFTDDD